MDTLQDVVIVGSGPAGYTAAIYLGRAGHHPLLAAGALNPGGQLINTTEVENFPGFPDGIMGPDLMDRMQRQAERFGTEIVWDDVTSIDVDQNTGEAEFSGRGVSYCATCDGFFFRNKPIVVVGGGDSAFEEALFLTRFGSSVTLIHRRSNFRASKILVERAKNNSKIDFVLDSVVQSIEGDANGAKSVIVRNVLTNEITEITANGIFIAIGHTPATSFLGDTVRRDERGYILVKGTGTLTSQPGIFAAGDCVDDTYRQAISAAGMGCHAALDAQHYLAEQHTAIA